MIFGHLNIVSVAVLLSTVACKDAGLNELHVTNENGFMGLHADSLCRKAGFVPMEDKKVAKPKSSTEDNEVLIAGSDGQSMSASTIILIVLAVVVVIICTVFLGNFLYNKAKANEYTL